MITRLLIIWLVALMGVGLAAEDETEIDVVGKQWLNPGLYTFAPQSIPDNTTGIGFKVDRRDMTDPTAHIEFSIQVSFDAGASWEAFRGASAEGGVIIDRGGSPNQWTKYLVEIAPGVGRLIKGQIEVSGDVANLGVKVRLRH